MVGNILKTVEIKRMQLKKNGFTLLELLVTEQGLAALNKNTDNSSKWAGPYLQKSVPNDPWDRPYLYKSPGDHGDYDLYSNGKDGQPGGTKESQDVVSW